MHDRTSMVIIQPAAPADADAIVAALRRSVRDLAHDYYAPALVERWIAEYCPEDVLLALDSPERRTLVARAADGMIVGVGTLCVSEGRVTQCYVTGAVARRGVGSRLLAALEDIARDAGFEQVRLQSSTGACAFYERNGYEPAGPPELYDDRYDVYPYRKTITPAARPAPPAPRP